MKKALLFASIILLGITGNTQTDVALKIEHKLGPEDFIYGSVSNNNLGHEFKVNRLEYYLSQITIIHDGGTETAVPLEIIALVQPGEELSTTIELGNYEVTEIESVKFYIGVHEPANNQDPALHPDDYPLALQDPSMHWGWIYGYKFIAFDGLAGDDFSTMFEMHSVGNDLYFETEAEIEVETDGDAMIMNVTANYVGGLHDIDLRSGPIEHGDRFEALKVLENWRDYVFVPYTIGLEEQQQETLEWSVFPNPSSGLVTVQFNNQTEIQTVQVLNPLGEIMQNTKIIDQEDLTLNLPTAGVYFVTALNENGVVIATEKIVNK